LLLAILLTPVLEDYIREAIVSPLLYLFWVGRLVLRSLPQAVIWSFFLAIAVLIAGRSLLLKRPAWRRAPRFAKARPGRIETWVKLIRRADEENYYKWQLAQQLRKLTVAVLAQDERLTPRQLQHRLAGRALDIPSEIQAYLDASLNSFGQFSDLEAGSRRQTQPSPLDLDPEQILEFLEGRFQ
jgi:hypothetical protein